VSQRYCHWHRFVRKAVVKRCLRSYQNGLTEHNERSAHDVDAFDFAFDAVIESYGIRAACGAVIVNRASNHDDLTDSQVILGPIRIVDGK
jgi:hypothetical protein